MLSVDLLSLLAGLQRASPLLGGDITSLHLEHGPSHDVLNDSLGECFAFLTGDPGLSSCRGPGAQGRTI